ncbi:hypothetical protein FOFC_15679 [Fusarium oxysporum]|nr:hypothetical protein FOFC_15679 [Fusarium oxysporum]
MAPDQESEKPDKFGPVIFTTRLGAEHGRVTKPLHGAPLSKHLKTRPSSPPPPGATEVKVKEEIVSPSATNFLPRRPTPRTTKSLGDSPRRSDPQPYTSSLGSTQCKSVPALSAFGCTSSSSYDDISTSDSTISTSACAFYILSCTKSVSQPKRSVWCPK